MGLQLEAMRLEYKSDPAVAQCASDLQSLLESAMAKVRTLSMELNPSVVERAGLHFALEQLTARYKPQFSGPVRLHYDPAIHLPRDIAKAFYRVAEYTFEYAAARTSSSQIEVQVRSRRDTVIMEIRHDGAPPAGQFQPGPAERVESLMLQYHAKRAGVPVTIESVAGQGTIVSTSYKVKVDRDQSANI